ncbi:PIR Superfamily Protein [Plasmodium ovale wallikeri]|uniref:PIR protein n=2 Tax=Plasmodium ovale TaxID=36330 RepID=A0A1C3KJ30_PLAOA|nr:PIR Superfamily Protein [Plasmodium ovale wallikeri]SBT73885.1 PIR protein [Plasmodium ovale]
MKTIVYKPEHSNCRSVCSNDKMKKLFGCHHCINICSTIIYYFNDISYDPYSPLLVNNNRCHYFNYWLNSEERAIKNYDYDTSEFYNKLNNLINLEPKSNVCKSLTRRVDDDIFNNL